MRKWRLDFLSHNNGKDWPVTTEITATDLREAYEYSKGFCSEASWPTECVCIKEVSNEQENEVQLRFPLRAKR